MSEPPHESLAALSARPCVIPPESDRSSEPSDFTAIYRATVAPLRRYLARILGNAEAAEDVAQDTFIRYHAHSHGEEIRSPKHFLFTIGRKAAPTRWTT